MAASVPECNMPGEGLVDPAQAACSPVLAGLLLA